MNFIAENRFVHQNAVKYHRERRFDSKRFEIENVNGKHRKPESQHMPNANDVEPNWPQR